MIKKIIFVLAVLSVYVSAQATPPVVQINPDSQVGLVSGICFCVNPRLASNPMIEEELTEALYCFCVPSGANVTEDGERSAPIPILDPAVVIPINTTTSTLLCTCMYQLNDTEDQSFMSNPGFLLPGFNGTFPVPLQCTCRDANSLAEIARTVGQMDIPALVSTASVNGLLALLPLLSIDQLRSLTQFIPTNCNCSIPTEDLFNAGGVFENFTFTGASPSAACRCVPSLNDLTQNLTLDGDFVIPFANVSLNDIKASLPALDFAGLWDSVKNLTESTGFTLPSVGFAIPEEWRNVIVPPFINVTYLWPWLRGNQGQSVTPDLMSNEVFE